MKLCKRARINYLLLLLLLLLLFHKFFFTLEKKFAQITLYISILDPWLESGQIQKLLSHLLVKANRFI